MSSKKFLDKYFIGSEDFWEYVTDCDVRVKIIQSDNQSTMEENTSEEPYDPGYDLVPIEFSQNNSNSTSVPRLVNSVNIENAVRNYPRTTPEEHTGQNISKTVPEKLVASIVYLNLALSQVQNGKRKSLA